MTESPRAAIWEDLARRASALCAAHGFDLLQPFRVGAYNERVADPALRLPDFSRGTSLGLLIGNSAALWPRFRAALAADPALACHRMKQFLATRGIA